MGGVIRNKLNGNPELIDAYHSVFVEYFKLNMIERVDSSEGKIICYLPHRPVIRAEKVTSKIRPVFDASATDDSGTSLNDMLLPGPNLLPELFHVLIRFRAFSVSLVADIEKAFLQIGIRPEDRDALRFLWFDVSKPVDANSNRGDFVEYRLTRLPFGLTSSPFLLQAVVRHHLEQFRGKDECQLISDNIYVDDLVLSTPDEETAKRIKEKAEGIFKTCSMNLRKWTSNIPSLNEKGADSCEIKVLGLHYEPSTDTVKIACPKLVNDCPTKRQVLQSIASIFDPLGVIAPVVTTMKLFFQRIVQLNIEWDEAIPEELSREWNGLKNQLN